MSEQPESLSTLAPVSAADAWTELRKREPALLRYGQAIESGNWPGGSKWKSV